MSILEFVPLNLGELLDASPHADLLAEMLNNEMLNMSTEPTNPITREFIEQCQSLRHQIKRIAADVKVLSAEAAVNRHSSTASDAAEMAANLMLAYRHLEDAAMRIGKSVQAYDGGVSVYDEAHGSAASARR